LETNAKFVDFRTFISALRKNNKEIH